MERELSFWEKAVWLSFNPSQNPAVDFIKKKFAEIIDWLNEARTIAGQWEKGRLLSVAITEAQTAQMRAVKGITRDL